jgi:hypothetical protein
MENRAAKFKNLFNGNQKTAFDWLMNPSLLTLPDSKDFAEGMINTAKQWSIDKTKPDVDKYMDKIINWTRNPSMISPDFKNKENYIEFLKGWKEPETSRFMIELRRLILKGNQLRGRGLGITEWRPAVVKAPEAEATIGQKRPAPGSTAERSLTLRKEKSAKRTKSQLAGGLGPEYPALKNLKKNINLNTTELAEVLINISKASQRTLERAKTLYNRTAKKFSDDESVVKVRNAILGLLGRLLPTKQRSKTTFVSKIKRI